MSVSFRQLRSEISTRYLEIKGCGANAPGGGGFQTGNTCGKVGGGSSIGTLDAALSAYKPEIEKRYADIVTTQFNRMVESLGPELSGIHNNWTYAKTFSATVRPNVDRVNVDPLKPTKSGIYQINPDKLAANASKYADSTIDSWKGKIRGKLGELENATVHGLSNQSFRITGTKGGKNVEISQQMIINVSKNGTLFNQFPSRITVDGKPISEAKFKDLG